jgi:hypothetical protein
MVKIEKKKLSEKLILTETKPGKGARIALYCYNVEKKSKLAIFDSYVYKRDKRKNN